MTLTLELPEDLQTRYEAVARLRGIPVEDCLVDTLRTLAPDPVAELIRSAPEEDEELSDEGHRMVEEGLRASREGRVVTDAELARQLGW